MYMYICIHIHANINIWLLQALICAFAIRTVKLKTDSRAQQCSATFLSLSLSQKSVEVSLQSETRQDNVLLFKIIYSY